MIPAKTPAIIKKAYPSYVWDFSKKGKKNIYLTFDDGPIPEVTEFVLKQLHEYDAKATFFCIGDNIKKHPEIFKRIIEQEQGIGNHTMHHLKAWETSNTKYLQNIEACEIQISTYVETLRTKLFRPPYGQISIGKLNEVKKMGYEIILWDILSKDWQQKMTPEKCLNNIIQHTQPGSIIVFHDSLKAYHNLKSVLPKVLEYFSEKGFIFDKIEP